MARKPYRICVSESEYNVVKQLRQGLTPSTESHRFDADGNFRGVTKNFKLSQTKNGNITTYFDEEAARRTIDNSVNALNAVMEQYVSFDLDYEQYDTTHVFSTFDAHFGAVYWKGGTTHNYDLKRVTAAYESIVARALGYMSKNQPREIILVVGNDLFNVDTKTTTFAGTPQTNDYRLKLVTDVIVNTVLSTITLFSGIAPVKVVCVPGNHDKERMVILGSFIEYFVNQTMLKDRVKVYAEQKTRKYLEVGSGVLAFSHYDGINDKKIQPVSLYEIMQDISIGKPKWIEALGGHLHHLMTKEEYGVVFRRLRALCPNSVWAFESGFVGAKTGGHLLEYDKTYGYLGERFFNFDYSLTD